MDSLVIRHQLDPKHKKFADQYLKTNRKAASAVFAGYSKRSSHTEASRLLKRPDIAAYIAARVAEATEPAELLGTKAEALGVRVVKEMETLAFANIADLIVINANGEPSFDLSKATREQLAAISSLKTKSTKRYDNKGAHIATENEVAINLADKYRGLELLGRHLGLFKAEEQRVIVDVADRLLNARRRLALAGADASELLTDARGA